MLSEKNDAELINKFLTFKTLCLNLGFDIYISWKLTIVLTIQNKIVFESENLKECEVFLNGWEKSKQIFKGLNIIDNTISDKNVIYEGKIDPECINLCNAINKIKGIETFSSCCGHEKNNFRIWIKVNDLKNLPILLYYLDPCHVGFQWVCKVTTDCAMSPVTFCIESLSFGEKAYNEAEIIANEINNALKG